MGHYKSVIDTDNILHQQCNITGNILVPGLNDLHPNWFEILNTFCLYFLVDFWYTIKTELVRESSVNKNIQDLYLAYKEKLRHIYPMF